VLKEKLRFLNQHLPAGIALSFLTSLCLAFSFYSVMDKRRMALWLGSASILAVARALTIRTCQSQARVQDQLGTWRRSIELGALGQGLLWGLASILLFPPSSVSQYFVISVLVGVTGGAIIFLAPIWSVYLLFLIPAMVPLTLRMLIQGSTSDRTLGALGLVYTAAMVMVSARTSRWLEDALIGALAEMRYRALFDAMTDGFTHADINEVFSSPTRLRKGSSAFPPVPSRDAT
jgi:hypothetical protein